MRTVGLAALVVVLLGTLAGLSQAQAAGPDQKPAEAAQAEVEKQFQAMLDAPLLFVKRHSYTGIHIYDTYYKWPPGGGGIYVLENPSAPREQWKVRPVIDPTTPGTLGEGVYTHPELSWDATKLLFCFKGEPQGSTSIYEINVDGTGLRRVSDPRPACECHKGSGGGQHDIAPAYLPDGRIVCLSTRPSGLVPCANEGVSILHVMNADGSDLHPISVNNVNEFDPSVLPDGRVMFGRWEYVDKNALTIQSLWTINPDGTNETALFANNMVFPEAILDARPVPNSPLVVGTFAKHNAPPRGSIAMVDPRKGKNGPQGVFNFEHPDNPTADTGDSCEPWPLSENAVIYSGRPAGQPRNVLEMIDRQGRRMTLLSDPAICLHSPMLVKPRPRPLALPSTVDRQAKTGRFFVQDIYRGLTGVKRGEVKWLRVVEETSRVSPTPGGNQPYNQTFLVSCALAFSVKNYLGVVPVEEDGSAYFEVPSGRAVYLQALDADKRLVQSMRTFVQAAPGVTRSCIGCHEYKYGSPTSARSPEVVGRQPQRLQPESWGTGYLDFPTMVQPVLDRHCVSCHGGEKGIGGRLDLTGGWTQHFSISYENLTNRCETQLVAYWIAGIDCMNGTAFWSARQFTPRSHGSGAAPLAKTLLTGHEGRIPKLSPKERDLLLAWIDGNGLYHGTWDYTKYGCDIRDWDQIKQAVLGEMAVAGCVRCHGANNQIAGFSNDWINLKDPTLSRVLRAPLPKDSEGLGLGICRDRSASQQPRVRLLCNGYAHAVVPIEHFAPTPYTPPSTEGQPVVSFASTADPHYQALLAAIRKGRELALATPRVDLPGAEVMPGQCRTFLPPPVPSVAPAPQVTLGGDGEVYLTWDRSADTIGLEAEVHRSNRENFAPGDDTLVARTSLFEYVDKTADPGRQYYAIVLSSAGLASKPGYTSIIVPPAAPPPAPTELKASSASHAVRLTWAAPRDFAAGYHVYRAKEGSTEFEKITPEPVVQTSYADGSVDVDVAYSYAVRTVSRRGIESSPSATATAKATIIKEPVFLASLADSVVGLRHAGQPLAGTLHGPGRIAGGILDVTEGGFVSFPHAAEFDLDQPISVEFWVKFEKLGPMPVLVSCGLWNQAGWFLQQIGSQWRWHVGGLDCDGGQPQPGRWIHLAATFDGRTSRLFQDGVQVAERTGRVTTAPWPGELCIGQYGQQAPSFQVTGRMTGVKLYHRPLTPDEAAAAAKTKPQ